MPSQLKIDQDGLPDGTPGRSRTDGLSDGSLVTLTNTGPGATTLLRLLWTPPGDESAPASLAVTEEPNVWTFSPSAGCYGTYLIELVVNAGLSSEVRERRTLVVRTPNLGLIIPALNERGDDLASLADERPDAGVDNNADDFDDPALAALTFAGWWRALHELIMRVDDAGAAPVPGSITGSTTGEQIDAIVAVLVAAELATDDRPPP